MRLRSGSATLSFCLLCLMLCACKSTGVGSGESSKNDIKTTFAWEESGPTSGTLKATVMYRDGTEQHYQGKFTQITKESDVSTITPVVQPWYPGWSGWAYWPPEPTESFVTHYTGHVVANLAGPDGRMRCHFQLLHSSEGLQGGGQGECQLPTGQTINAEFPAS